MIKRPLISEKSMSLAKIGFYSFEIERGVSKLQIAKFIKKKFNVEVTSVKTINIPAKKKMQRTKRKTYTLPSRKKAIVQLKKGQKLSLFEDMGKEELEVKTDEVELVKEKKSLLGSTKVKIEKAGSRQQKVSSKEKAKKGESK